MFKRITSMSRVDSGLAIGHKAVGLCLENVRHSTAYQEKISFPFLDREVGHPMVTLPSFRHEKFKRSTLAFCDRLQFRRTHSQPRIRICLEL